MCPCRTASLLCRLSRKDLVTSGEVLELGEAAPAAPWTASSAPRKSDGGSSTQLLWSHSSADLTCSLEGRAASQECHWETAKPCTARWLLPVLIFMGASWYSQEQSDSMERYYRALGAALRDSGAQASFFICPLGQREGVWKSHFIKKRSLWIVATQGAQFF